MKPASILLVEDDTNLGLVLQEYLQLKDYHVKLCCDGEAGWEAFRGGTFDVCILDVMMPKKDGFTLAKAIREENQHVPIIFVTAKSMQQDRIDGFRLGADDYVTKPFSVEELLLRVQAILRRAQAVSATSAAQRQEIFTIGEFAFDYPNQTLIHNRETRQLTSKEAELLRILCLNIGQALRRDVALKAIWGDDTYFNGRSMDVYITKLRKYLKLDESVEIVNVHGLGYKLNVRAPM